jgi:CAAX amino terminal protease family.
MHASAPSLRTSLWFCLTVFAFSAVLWLLVEFIGEEPDIPVNLPVSSLMAFFPLIAACIFAFRREKGKGVRKLLLRLADWRSVRRNVWYLPALFLVPAALFASWLYMTLANYPLPEPDLHLPAIPVMFVVFLIGAAGEEAGWMVFLVDPLQRRLSAFAAAVVCGAVWAVWHIIPWMQAGNDAGWIAWHSLVTVWLRVIIVWVYNNAGRSVWMAVLVHAAANVAFFAFPDYGSHYDPMVTGVVLTAVVVVIVLRWGGRTLASQRTASP